jgi:hypothetical protein
VELLGGENEDAWILTMGRMPEAEFEWREGRLLTHGGAVPSVLHQYDRFRELKREIPAAFRRPEGSAT